jgi:hypothetical protein
MRIAVVAVLGVGIGWASMAVAQTDGSYLVPPSSSSRIQKRSLPNDAAARKAVVPYIRAATDCMANAMRVDPAFADAAIANDLSPLRSNAFKVCTEPMVSMIIAHDTAYNQGKGMEFLKGPYSDDLDRALRVRLGEEMVRIRLRKLEEEKAKEQEFAAKKARADELITKAYDCVWNELKVMLLAKETSEDVSNAAITLCRLERDAAISEIMSAFKLSGNLETRIRSEKTFKDKVLAIVIKMRAIADNSVREDGRKSLPSTARDF